VRHTNGSSTRALSPCAFGLFAPLFVAILGGCASMVAGAPNAIFDLSAPSEVVAAGGNAQILVPEPTTVRALDTERIAARPNAAQYAYLPGVVWSDRLPKLLQARLVETIQNSGRVRAAAVPGQGLLIDYQLVVDVRAFELAEEGAIADFAVRLMDDRTGRVVRSRVFREVIPVTSTQAGMVVWALDQAMDRAFIQIVRWALQ
jgi:cholesterol transport system auxiliary component